jgi:hypothetical protein
MFVRDQFGHFQNASAANVKAGRGHEITGFSRRLTTQLTIKFRHRNVHPLGLPVANVPSVVGFLVRFPIGTPRRDCQNSRLPDVDQSVATSIILGGLVFEDSMPDQTNTVLPLVRYEVSAYRSGLGILRLEYLPAVPGSALSEDEARSAMLSLSVTVTENICNELAESLQQLALELAKAKAARQ